MRRTHASSQVEAAILADPAGKHWGYELSKTSGVRPGVLYPILHRMLDAGWLVDGWENPRDIEGRPPRRYYELTDEGCIQLASRVA